MSIGTLFSIQPFSIHDGPGVRTSLFLKGCALACQWCHNPESQSAREELMFHSNRCVGCGACVLVCPGVKDGRLARESGTCLQCGRCAAECFSGALEMCGFRLTAEEAAQRALKDKAIYDSSQGGVTFTGGEPLLQADFVRDTARILRGAGVHCAVETCLYAPEESAEVVLREMDMIFADVKCVTDETHSRGTGQDTRLIRKNFARALNMGIPIVPRTPVIPGFNDTAEEMDRVADYEAGLGVKYAELMTFHNTCAGKYAALGRTFALSGAQPPDVETMEGFARLFRQRGIEVKIRR